MPSTASPRRGRGSRSPTPARFGRIILASLLVAAACSEKVLTEPPPLDRFNWPIGLAVQPRAAGGSTLVVVSSNFDLSFDPVSGGTVLAVDPAAANPFPALGAVRIASFGGPVAIADRTACGLQTSSLAVVASRYMGELYRIALDDQGGLSCGADCVVPMPSGLTDPYGVTVVCTSSRQVAYVGFLGASGNVPTIAEVDLTAPAGAAVTRTFPAGSVGQTYETAYEAETDRLWVTIIQNVNMALVDAVAIGEVCDPFFTDCPPPIVGSYDLAAALRGAEVRGIALSTPLPATGGTVPPRRAFVAVRLFDPDVASSIGGRPSYDVGGALAVLELPESGFGGPAPRLVRIVPLGPGTTTVRVLPAPRAPHADGSPRRDLVAVVSETDATLTLYDDDDGSTPRVFGLSTGAGDPSGLPLGVPQMGRQPFGMAVETRTETVGGVSRVVNQLYVGAFDSSIVQVVRIDPDDPAGASIVRTLGVQR